MDIQERINATPFAKDHLLCLLRSRTPGMQARLATSLAHLLEPDDIARAYGPYGGAAVLLEQACDPELAVSDPPAWERALEALQRVVKSCKERQDKNSTSFVPAPPEEKVCYSPSNGAASGCLAQLSVSVHWMGHNMLPEAVHPAGQTAPPCLEHSVSPRVCHCVVCALWRETP